MTAAGREAPTPFGLRHRLRNERRPYHRDELQKVPRERSGVYALWLPSVALPGEHDCIYVGKSETCVRRRLLDHLRRAQSTTLRSLLVTFRDVVEFSVVYVADRAETDDLETSVIRAWDPETNRQKRL